jgi:hypothetical protein
VQSASGRELRKRETLKRRVLVVGEVDRLGPMNHGVGSFGLLILAHLDL